MKHNILLKIFKSPLLILLSLLVALCINLYVPELAASMKVPSGIYLSCLQMCIMPLLICSLIKSFSLLIMNNKLIGTSGKIIMTYVIGLVSVTFFAILFCWLFPIGKSLSKDIMGFAGFEYGLKPAYLLPNEAVFSKQSFIDIISSIFPSNILDSINKSVFLQVIFASIMMGCSAGYLSDKKKEVFDNLITAVEDIFKRIIKWIALFLPLGSLFIFSYGFSKVTPKILYFLAPILIAVFIFTVLIILVTNIFISRKLRVPFWTYLRFLKEPLIITSSTTSVMAAMPSFLWALTTKLKLDEKLVSLFGPLSLAMFRVGNAFYFAIITVYAGQIFSIPLGMWEYALILAMSVLISFAAVSNGIINLALLSIIFSPVGIPSSLIIILFAAIDPLVDPLRCLMNVYVNAACTTFSLNGKVSKEEL